MEKKYQFFVSSTYEDLQEERDAAIHAILTMNQFPIGMEMFSAADDDQWTIIKEAIDSSDYYILIVGNCYGSVDEETKVSYTEKEFDYAIAQGIPVLAFIIDKTAMLTPDKMECDGEKIVKLNAFKEKVKNSGRYVKFWRNKDNLESLLSQSISKAVIRGGRPGWVRTMDFDIEKSHAEILGLTERVHTLEALNADLKMQSNRKPNLWVDIRPEIDSDGKVIDEDTRVIENGIHFHVIPVDLSDAENGIDYKDFAGRSIHVEKEEVRLFRYVYGNGFLVYFRVHNDGDARATGVRVNLEFPKELLVLSKTELYEYLEQDKFKCSKDAYEGWNLKFSAPNRDGTVEETKEKFITFHELSRIEDIANLLDPADMNEVVSIFQGEVTFDKKEVRHKEWNLIDGVCILPTRAGKFVISCEILCNEYPDSIKQEIIVEVE
jgi:hypothetical protein